MRDLFLSKEWFFNAGLIITAIVLIVGDHQVMLVFQLDSPNQSLKRTRGPCVSAFPTAH
jgi:hypothetical protein